MKVCHMTSAHSSVDVRIFHKECSSLAKAGYDTYLVARGENQEENGVHIVGVGSPPAGRLRRMTVFAKRVYEAALALDADIYHLHDPELLPYGLKLKKRGKKVIFDSHEDTLNQMADKKWIPSELRPIVSELYKAYASNAFKKMDALISVTPHIVDELKMLNSNTYQITNYPMLEDFPGRTNGDTGCFKLCFTGGIDEQWSHKDVLAAIADMDNIRYIFCGLSEKAYIDQLSETDGWEKTDYLGSLLHSEAIQLQRSSDVGMALLRPSNNSSGKTGTIGNTKLFEYMMNGLPVICTDFALWKQIIDRYQCGICVSPSDIAGITQAISFLKNNPDKAEEMGINGRRAVEEIFNWSTQEEKLLELYNSLKEKKDD